MDRSILSFLKSRPTAVPSTVSDSTPIHSRRLAPTKDHDPFVSANSPEEVNLGHAVLIIGCVRQLRLAKHLLEDVEISTIGNEEHFQSQNDNISTLLSRISHVFSHVIDYVGWSVKCLESLRKKSTPGLFFILVSP